MYYTEAILEINDAENDIKKYQIHDTGRSRIVLATGLFISDLPDPLAHWLLNRP